MNDKALNIGVITRYVENFYFGTLLKGIQKAVMQEKGRLYIFNTYMLNRFRMNVTGDESYYSFSYNHIDAWIIISLGVKDEYINMVHSSGKPVVQIGYERSPFNCASVLDDSYNNAKQAVEHLLHHGHKRIAYIGCTTHPDMVQRHLGYKDVLEAHGLYDESIVYNVEFPMPEDAKELLEDILDKGIDFTAVFAANDFLALGLIEGFWENNVSVPGDVAVIGYDNSDQARFIKPALSSVDQNTFKMGEEAGKTAFRLLRGENIKEVKIKSDLVIRESCGCMLEKVENDENDMKLKSHIIKRLEDDLYKNSDLGTKIFTLGLSDIYKIIPKITDNYKWFCFGLFNDSASSKSKIEIHTIIDKTGNTTSNTGFECDLKDFPPAELIPYDALEDDDVINMLPVSSEKKNVGLIAYIAKLHKESSMFVYDMNVTIYNLLGIAIDRNLAMTDLKDTLESLKKTQDQLIESEKLVSLGSLITGVAHEINNPIGVAITASTYLENLTLQLKELFETNKLSKAELIKIMEKSTESVKILLSKLQQASNLIKSFKQIAVDNTIDEKRIFNVKDYLSDVILSLNAKLKRKGITVDLECPEDLQFYCNPGEISQVFTNLIVNSITHAYDDESNGRISIKFAKKKDCLEIEYADDGKGMEKEVIARAFEPFFTTKKGSEGSGLGLNVISNIIKQKFGGTIECESEYNIGTRFLIRLPLSLIPAKERLN